MKKEYSDYNIINPNGDIVYTDMSDCYDTILKSDIVVFSSTGNYISKGVHDEIKFAQSKDIKVVWLDKNRFYERFFFEIYDFEDWKNRYAIVGKNEKSMRKFRAKRPMTTCDICDSFVRKIKGSDTPICQKCSNMITIERVFVRGY